MILPTKRALMILTALSTLSFASCAAMPDKLIWKHENENDKNKSKAEKLKEKSGGEVTPKGLKKSHTTPITPEEAKRTALSRPQIVKIEELDENKRGGKYFDVVEDPAAVSLTPAIDEAAKPTRVVTYDNNSVQKEYPMAFGVAWGRIIEAMLETPLDAVDRSSGVIITDWIRDQSAQAQNMLAINPFAPGGGRIIRYKYTIRVMDAGAVTKIKVTPFAEYVKDRTWKPIMPSLLVTKRMFTRIERELKIGRAHV